MRQDLNVMGTVIGFAEWNIGKALREKETSWGFFVCFYLELLEVWEILDSS